MTVCINSFDLPWIVLRTCKGTLAAALVLLALPAVINTAAAGSPPAGPVLPPPALQSAAPDNSAPDNQPSEVGSQEIPTSSPTVVLPEKPTGELQADSSAPDSSQEEHSQDAVQADTSTDAPPTPFQAIESRPLGGSASTSHEGAAGANSKRPWWLQTLAALTIVIALLLGLRAVLQRLARMNGGIAAQFGPGGRAPSGVLEVLGRYPISKGNTLVLLRMDRRIMLLGQSSAGFATLAQVTDPEEVASLLIKTRDEEGQSIAARFNSLLHDVEQDAELVDEPVQLPEVAARAPRTHSSHSTAESTDPATRLHNRLLGLRGLEA